MDFDIKQLIHDRSHELYELHEKYINRQFVKVLRTIDFDKAYTHCEGYYLYDAKGHRYTDYITGYGVFALGRNHPTVVQALQDYISSQAPNLIKMDCTLLAGILAEKLIQKSPKNIQNVFFTNSGAESVETALKYARCATQKTDFVFLDHGFHGLTCGALSVNGNKEFHEGFGELLPGCHKIMVHSLSALEGKLRDGDVAAFICEPIQGKGVHILGRDFLCKAQDLCKKYGALFIVDEIQTGFGRTGTFFALEHDGLEPDIITISKAMSGGLVPVGAVLTTRKIYDSVFSRMDRCVVHSSTFSQNGMAMAAALATLHVIDNNGILDNAKNMGALFLESLEPLVKKYEFIKEVRGRGLMIAIEFHRPKSLGLRTAWDMIHKINPGLFAQMIIMPLLSKHHILTQVAGHNMDVIKLLPALTLREDDIHYFVESLDTVLRESTRFPGNMWSSMLTFAKNTVFR